MTFSLVNKTVFCYLVGLSQVYFNIETVTDTPSHKDIVFTFMSKVICHCTWREQSPTTDQTSDNIDNPYMVK